LASSLAAALAMLVQSRHEAPGLGRFFLTMPYVVFALLVPLQFPIENVVARAVTAGQYAWWSNFKIFAFCCGRGPLTHPMVDGPGVFMTILLLPFSPHRTMLPSTVGTRVARATKKPEPVEGQLAEFAAKLALKATLLSTFVFVMTKHPPQNIYFRDLVLCFALYAFLGVLEDGLGCVSATLLNNLPVERSFEKFYLSSSIREFWSKRWNQHVAKLLKCVVYEPIVEGRVLRAEHHHHHHRRPGRPSVGARVLGTLATFLASGVMHEVVFAYVTGGVVTYDWLAFFTLQGAYVLCESVLHLTLRNRWNVEVPKWIGIPITWSFLIYTGELHFFKPVRLHGIDTAFLASLAGIIKM